MKTEYIPKIITLLAGAVVCIISIVRHMDVTYSLELLLAVLILFYIIGCLARRIIDKTIAGNSVIKQNQELENLVPREEETASQEEPEAAEEEKTE